jgi:hypothetical protein
MTTGAVGGRGMQQQLTVGTHSIVVSSLCVLRLLPPFVLGCIGIQSGIWFVDAYMWPSSVSDAQPSWVWC